VAQLSLLEHGQSVQNSANRDLLRLMNHKRRATVRYVALVTPICDGNTTTDDRLDLHWSADRPPALERRSDEPTEWTLENS